MDVLTGTAWLFGLAQRRVPKQTLAKNIRAKECKAQGEVESAQQQHLRSGASSMRGELDELVEQIK